MLAHRQSAQSNDNTTPEEPPDDATANVKGESESKASVKSYKEHGTCERIQCGNEDRELYACAECDKEICFDCVALTDEQSYLYCVDCRKKPLEDTDDLPTSDEELSDAVFNEPRAEYLHNEGMEDARTHYPDVQRDHVKLSDFAETAVRELVDDATEKDAEDFVNGYEIQVVLLDKEQQEKPRNPEPTYYMLNHLKDSEGNDEGWEVTALVDNGELVKHASFSTSQTAVNWMRVEYVRPLRLEPTQFNLHVARVKELLRSSRLLEVRNGVTFLDCLIATTESDFVKEWERLNKKKLVATSPIEKMIDTATGYDKVVLQEYIDAVYNTVFLTF